MRVRSNQFPALHPRRDRPALPPPNANPSYRSADRVPMTLIPCVKSKNDDQHNHQRPVVDLRWLRASPQFIGHPNGLFLRVRHVVRTNSGTRLPTVTVRARVHTSFGRIRYGRSSKSNFIRCNSLVVLGARYRRTRGVRSRRASRRTSLPSVNICPPIVAAFLELIHCFCSLEFRVSPVVTNGVRFCSKLIVLYVVISLTLYTFVLSKINCFV